MSPYFRNDCGDFIPANQDESDAFMETLGVETVYSHQLQLVKSAREIMGVREHLAAVLDNLSDDLVAEVRDFAEFLQQKQQQVNTPAYKDTGVSVVAATESPSSKKESSPVFLTGESGGKIPL
ncbi:DUF2281 domain-containing protein [Lyngbya aestuarii]|uniref:DUF2281 domain-containing protein n=1 Tax=Lyngbya aestuarii TaxID=118322 RepID=UPI00403DC5A0